MTVLRKTSIKAQDSASIDAFGRWRVSAPETLFDSKQLYNSQPFIWDDQETSGSGTASAYTTNEASTRMSVSATTAGTRVRQTFQRFNYQPGKSQQIILTGNFISADSGITKRIGLFDDENGLFFQLSGTTLSVVTRTFTSGAAVDNAVAQDSWNIDPLDGTGESGITLDLTKSQIFFIDYEWLGVGRVRMGFVIDGLIYYCHEFLNSNVLALVYMSTPNLPLRYEISNDGTGAASDLDHICCSVVSEGGSEDLGIVLSQNIGSASVNANVVGTRYALIGLQLKSTHLSSTVKIFNLALQSSTNDKYLWELFFNPTVAGTFIYSSVNSISAVESALGDTTGNPSTNTVTGGTLVTSGYGTQQNSLSTPIDTARTLGASIAGVRDTLVLSVMPMTTNLDIKGALTWRELV